MADIANPHDAFCKYVLGRPEQARAFLSHFLPEEIRAPLDLESLATAPGSFVDPELANHHSDLLFSVTRAEGKQSFIYVLFEHKSMADRKTPLQLLRYMERIWDAHLKDNGRLPLPAILPVVIHQGPPAWPYPPHFGDIVDCPPGHARFVPSFEFHLVDLWRVGDDEMPSEPLLGGALLTMKHIHSPDLSKVIRSHGLHISAIYPLPNGLEFLKTMLRYIFLATPTQRRKAVWTALEQSVTKGEEIVRTIADSLIEEGFDKGMDKGLNLGRAEGMNLGRVEGINLGRAESAQNFADMIVEVLELRFEAVPQRLRERIHGIGEPGNLNRLRHKLRDADSIEDCERIVSSETPH